MGFWKTAALATVLAAAATAAHAQTEVKYTYDGLGRVTSVTYLGGEQDGATIEYKYDAAGNRTQVVRVSPIVAGPGETPTARKMVVIPMSGYFVLPVDGS